MWLKGLVHPHRAQGLIETVNGVSKMDICKNYPRKSIIAVSLLSALCIPYAESQDYFNPALLEMTSTAPPSVDLSSFEAGTQAPGTYRVDVFINKQLVDTKEIEFKQVETESGNNQLQPCLSVAQLKSWGVKTENYPDLGDIKAPCAKLSAIPQAIAEFKFNDQRLNLSIPQIAIVSFARGYVPPEQWDDGINALLLNYSVSASTTVMRNGSGGTQNNQYVNLRPGVNFGAWRYRNYSTWNHSDDGQNNWNSVYNYVTRDIKSLKSQLILGDSVSPSDVFDSVAFRGAQASSDDDMLPDSQKGFAPVIRGIARSNAEVTIEQNGYTIYKTTVPPGAFEINDMYPTGGSGDMTLIIKESDGSEQSLVIPYASLPVLQREGRLKYSLTGGQTRSNDSNNQKLNFGQMTAIYGIPWGTTIYGGAQQADNRYTSVALGTGINLGDIGALSMDVTQAWSKLSVENDSSSFEQRDGQSLRVRYSKNIAKTGTNFNVAGYRYSTSGYYTLQDTLSNYHDNFDNNIGRRRNRTDVSLSQDVVFGSVSLSLINEDYWDKNRMSSVSVGYNNSWKSISYGFNYTYSKNSRGSSDDNDNNQKNVDQQFSFNVSIPLDKWLAGSSATYSLNSSKNRSTTHNVGLNGTALEDNNLNWSVQEGYVSDDQANTGSANVTYQGTYSKLNAGYGYDDYADRFSYGIQGGVVVHGDGVTLSQPLSDTVVLVKAPGAKDVPVNNQTGVKTDSRGYAVVPYASPYRKSDISLNTEDIKDNNLELDDTSKSVVPTRGAVVRAEYMTQTGFRALITLEYANGVIPFGAIVSNTNTGNTKESSKSSIVGDDGQVFVAGLQEEGQLQVKWGKSANEQCTVNYRISPQETTSGVLILREKCL